MSGELAVEQISACVACGNPESSLILQQPEQYIAEGLRVYSCNVCSLL